LPKIFNFDLTAISYFNDSVSKRGRRKGDVRAERA
jgi:hypothetical protein